MGISVLLLIKGVIFFPNYRKLYPVRGVQVYLAHTPFLRKHNKRRLISYQKCEMCPRTLCLAELKLKSPLHGTTSRAMHALASLQALVCRPSVGWQYLGPWEEWSAWRASWQFGPERCDWVETRPPLSWPTLLNQMSIPSMYMYNRMNHWSLPFLYSCLLFWK